MTPSEFGVAPLHPLCLARIAILTPGGDWRCLGIFGHIGVIIGVVGKFEPESPIGSSWENRGLRLVSGVQIFPRQNQSNDIIFQWAPAVEMFNRCSI